MTVQAELIVQEWQRKLEKFVELRRKSGKLKAAETGAILCTILTNLLADYVCEESERDEFMKAMMKAIDNAVGREL